MDQIVGDDLRKNAHLAQLMAALSEGLYVVNGKGEILCVLQDVTRQHRSNGGVIAAIEAVIEDTSAMGRSLMEKIGALRRGTNADSDAALDVLTEREREVLGLICEGQDDMAMSKSLGLSRNTVRNHIASLYRKIGVNRRSAAIIWAREHGITAADALRSRPFKRSPRASHRGMN